MEIGMMTGILGVIWAVLFIAKVICTTRARTVAGGSVENAALVSTGMDDFRNQQVMNDMNFMQDLQNQQFMDDMNSLQNLQNQQFMDDMNSLQNLQNQQFMNDMNFMQDLQNRQFMNDMNTFSMNSVTPFEMGGFDMEQGNSFNLFDNMFNNCGSGFGDFGCGGMF